MGIITDKNGKSQFSRRSGFLIIIAHLAKGLMPGEELTITWPFVVLICAMYGFNKLAFAALELIKYLKGVKLAPAMEAHIDDQG